MLRADTKAAFFFRKAFWLVIFDNYQQIAKSGFRKLLLYIANCFSLTHITQWQFDLNARHYSFDAGKYLP